MAPLRISLGVTFADVLCKALGITGPVHRIVIDSAADDAVKVYVQRYLDQREGEVIAAALAGLAQADACEVVEVRGLDVDDRGNVTARR